jgi:NAD-dependent SIR2 family protein deacetylase
MTYQEFVGSPAARQRYWARSHVGWRRIGRALPNTGHQAVAAMEHAGVVHGVITQNVDGLHQAAGSREVVDLHGRLDTVRCLACGCRTSRAELQRRLAAANPDVDTHEVAFAPDGDALLADVSGFQVVACRSCGGVLKPDVVFFGENVPRERVDRCFGMLTAGRALLVAGSSLTVRSGYRFVLRASELGLPIVIINRGPTRGDPLATVRIDDGCSPALSALHRASTGQRAAAS